MIAREIANPRSEMSQSIKTTLCGKAGGNDNKLIVRRVSHKSRADETIVMEKNINSSLFPIRLQRIR